MSKLQRSITTLLLALSLLVPGRATLAADAMSGHIVMALLPLSGITAAYLQNDQEGKKQWLRNIGANQIIISIARIGFNEAEIGQRPEGGGYGFPSGHVAVAGAGASYWQERYGWEYGIPAWLAAGYVAWVRVDQNNHHWRDVIASGVISYGIGKLFITPQDASYIAPVIGPDWLGLRWERSF